MTSIALVVWKDEGDFGFIRTFSQADLDYSAAHPDEIGVPFDPNRVQAYGSRAEARALAKEHDVELRIA